VSFPQFYDADKIVARGRPVGSYEYTTVTGYKKTTRAFQAASVNKLTEFPPDNFKNALYH
jgi:hypothetical protein